MLGWTLGEPGGFVLSVNSAMLTSCLEKRCLPLAMCDRNSAGSCLTLALGVTSVGEEVALIAMRRRLACSVL